MKKKILISTGGSGGHVVPATIFYEQLKNEFDIFFTTDKRGVNFLNLEKYKIKIIDTPKISKNPFKLLIVLFVLFASIVKSFLFF